MGLPSKKQLHKHKRGARKALDTLEAMEVDSDIKSPEPDVEELIIKKKGKKHPEPAKAGEKDVKPIDDSADSEPSAPIPDPAEVPDETTVSEEEVVSDSTEKEITLEMNEEEGEPESSSELQEEELPLSGSAGDSIPDDAQAAEPLMNNDKDNPMPETVVDSNEDTSPDDEGEGRPTSFDGEHQDEGQEDTQKDKYLTFRIGEEVFGVSIQYVTEIIVMQRVTEVPDTPAFVKGVINLRGKVIPVIDIRKRFGLELRDYDERTCIVVVEHSETAVGMIVDTVNEVVDIPQQNVDPPPRSHSGIESTYLEGMGKIDKQVIILLDLGKVLFVEELLRKKRDYED